MEVDSDDDEHGGAIKISSLYRGVSRMVVLFTPSGTSGEGANQSTSSNIERMMEKIERRRENRLEVAKKVRKRFLRQCEVVAKKLGLNNKIPKEELLKLQEKNSGTNLEEVFNKACDKVTDDDMFYFRDFYQYDLKVRRSIFAKYPIFWMGFALLTYYLFSAGFLCFYLYEENVCPRGEDFPGWATALYFGSVTMSTVGYGDVSFVSSESQSSEPFKGVVFMVVSLIFGVTLFSAVSEELFKDFHGLDLNSFLFNHCFGQRFRNLPVWQQLERITVVRLTELTIYFFLLNSFGMCIAMLFVSDTEWTWMTAFYWAVQTTTTIGYGDLDMPENLRWFNMFYTLLGTAFLANILGSVANLRKELLAHQRLGAWKEREVSKSLIEDMDGDGDGQISEYEFLVSSLVTLKKVSKNDISEIMKKFKELSENEEYITKKDLERHIEGQNDEEDDDDDEQIGSA